MSNSEQLLLDLGHRTALAREDFLVARSNQDAVAWIDLWPDWPAPAVVIYGPVASGKSHIASVWQERSDAINISSCDLRNDCTAQIISEKRHAVIDLDDSWIGNRCCETTMFHIYNIFKEEKRTMLITLEKAPVRQDFIIKDLASRLRAAPAVGILAPDDELLAAVMLKMFSDRQLRVSSEFLSYVVPRIERSFSAARKFVEKSDRAALMNKRPITVSLAKEVLEEMSENYCDL